MPNWLKSWLFAVNLLCVLPALAFLLIFDFQESTSSFGVPLMILISGLVAWYGFNSKVDDEE